MAVVEYTPLVRDICSRTNIFCMKMSINLKKNSNDNAEL
jgi:hypothetical protein